MAPYLPITLWTPYYRAVTPERQAELDECLSRNLACPLIHEIVLLIDDGHQPPFINEKLQVVALTRRPTYHDWVAALRERNATGIALLANSDIYFDDSIGLLQEILQRNHTFVVLTRFDRVGDSLIPHPHPHWSQDAWALRIPADIDPLLRKGLDVPLGVPRCDNKIAYLFAVHGWALFNPFPHVRACHLHESGQRSYSKESDATVMGGVAYVHPAPSATQPATIDIAIWTRGHHTIRKLTVTRGWRAPRLGATVGPADATYHSKHRDPRLGSPSTSRRGTAEIGASRAGTPAQVRDIARDAPTVYQFRRRFFVYSLGDSFIFIDRLTLRSATKLEVRGPVLSPEGKLLPKLIAAFVLPVMDVAPIRVHNRPASRSDVNFWQYPCATEQHALRNHFTIPLGDNIDEGSRQVHTYLGLPWATYTDKSSFPGEGLQLVANRIRGLAALCAEHDYELRVHTVCQTIHWVRNLDQFRGLGVTDVHLSHCEQTSAVLPSLGDIRVHSWPLFAVNVETPDRCSGLVRGKPLGQKRYLASFIGAHMPHYRSDVRLRLAKLAQEDGSPDLLVQVMDKWHFNDVVYHEQVKGQTLSAQDQALNLASTQRYNEILSDSIFSLCPEGAGPNTLRLWESMAVGAIPVVIAENWQPPEIPDSELTLYDCCVFVDPRELNTLFQLLRSFHSHQITEIANNCLTAYSRIVRKLAFSR